MPKSGFFLHCVPLFIVVVHSFSSSFSYIYIKHKVKGRIFIKLLINLTFPHFAIRDVDWCLVGGRKMNTVVLMAVFLFL